MRYFRKAVKWPKDWVWKNNFLQIIFKLVVFENAIISFSYAPTISARDGGLNFGTPCIRHEMKGIAPGCIRHQGHCTRCTRPRSTLHPVHPAQIDPAPGRSSPDRTSFPDWGVDQSRTRDVTNIQLFIVTSLTMEPP